MATKFLASATFTTGLTQNVVFQTIVATDLPIFIGSGPTHAPGAVPDPGSVAGTTKFLREDATWAAPPGGSGTAGQGIPGLDGDDGVDGFPGATGPQGPQGPQGNAGAAGAQGNIGPQGIPGDDGDGADGWPGPQGPTGQQGVIGPAGAGIPGLDGDDGVDGYPGPRGNTGASGVTGPAGAGLPGLDGDDGADGFAGLLVQTPVFGCLKNKIINGLMALWQRGTSFTSAASGQYAADRWTLGKTGTMTVNLSQSATVPTVAQIGTVADFSYQLAVQTAEVSLAIGDFLFISQKIEGFTFRGIAQRTFTLSFWVQSTNTGTFCVFFRNSGSDRSYVATYTINSTNTWEYKSITIPASPSAGTWDYRSGVGLEVGWSLGAGTTFQTTAGSWQTGNFMCTSAQFNLAGTTLNNFLLCGVQCEPGGVSTSFEDRGILEVALCKRYYQKSYSLGVNPATNTTTGLYGGGTTELTSATHTPLVPLAFSPTMRGGPTMTFYNQTGTSGTWNNATSVALLAPASDSAVGIVPTTAVSTDGRAYGHWTADADL